MKNYKLAIFDLDGTLLDTLMDLMNSTNFALQEIGCPKRTFCEIRKFVGNGVRKLIERAVPIDTGTDDIEKALSIFKEHYENHCEENTKPYDGIIELLDLLIRQNILIAVVSNKIDSAVSVLCKQYFGNRIEISVGDKENCRKKPDPDSVFEVLNCLNIQKADAVYIGDSEVDIETAKNAGIDCISVTWGFRDKELLLDAWGFEKTDKLQKFPEKGILCGNITAYFADNICDIKDILIETKN